MTFGNRGVPRRTGLTKTKNSTFENQTKHNFPGRSCQAILTFYDDISAFLVPITPGEKTPYTELIRRQRGEQNQESGRTPASWKTYLESPPTQSEITEWLNFDPSCGIALITGNTTGLAVLDDDGGLPSDVSLPQTVGWTGKRGRNLLFRLTEPLPGTMRGDGVELLSGGYAVIPPSLHPSGNYYRYLPGQAPGETEVLPFPGELLSLFPNKKTDERKQEKRTSLEVGEHQSFSFACDEAATLKILAHYGIYARSLGVSFTSPLPGKLDSHPSAALWQKAPGETIWLHDFGESRQAWAAIPEIVRMQVTGNFEMLSPSLKMVWHLRGAIEAGVSPFPKLYAPPLVENVPKSTRKVYEGALLRAAVNSYITDGESCFSLSCRFLADWCGVGEMTAYRGLKWLEENGYLYRTGETLEGSYGRRTPLYALALEDELGNRRTRGSQGTARHTDRHRAKFA
jgi:hypothetical protein